ncbi:MAG: hypothetical protein ACTS77_01270 [Arsenophonus sp. NC-TX2-MAG3]
MKVIIIVGGMTEALLGLAFSTFSHAKIEVLLIEGRLPYKTHLGFDTKQLHWLRELANNLVKLVYSMD